jgi:hypothetical protein
MGHKGPVYKVYVLRDRKGSNPNANQSINNPALHIQPHLHFHSFQVTTVGEQRTPSFWNHLCAFTTISATLISYPNPNENTHSISMVIKQSV